MDNIGFDEERTEELGAYRSSQIHLSSREPNANMNPWIVDENKKARPSVQRRQFLDLGLSIGLRKVGGSDSFGDKMGVGFDLVGGGKARMRLEWRGSMTTAQGSGLGF